MESYTRLFSGIVHSSLWRSEPDHVRLVWVTMLALADKQGEVHSSVPGLADCARVTVGQCEYALERLSSPDEWSRTKDDEGRRIRAIDGGWLLLNHGKYRDMGGEALSGRERQKRYRDRKRAERDESVTRDVTRDGELRQHTPSTSTSASTTVKTKTCASDEHPAFADWWAAYPRKTNRKVAARAYGKAIGKLGELIGQKRLLDAVRDFAVYCMRTATPLDKTPHAATWLNQERWENDYVKQGADELKSSTETRHDPGTARRDAKAAGEHDDGARGLPTL
jgi:hypothetical protein